MAWLSWAFFLAGLIAALPEDVASVYVFKGNPYQQSGPFKAATHTLTKNNDGIAEHTEVFFPTTPGSYVPVIFVPGWNGDIYTEWYSTVLANFADYGYIVAGVDLAWPGASAGGRSQSPTRESTKVIKMFEVVQWLFDNLNQHVLPSQGAVNVMADWNLTGLLSHSAGAEEVLGMLKQKNHTLYNAVAFLEPFSFNFSSPLGYSIPALAHGTQLCTEFPPCCIKGLDYLEFYTKLTCPRIAMNVTGYGHCDILNEDPGWKLCNSLHFCKTDPSNNRDLYRNVFMPGLLASFFGTYLQGNTALLQYITTRDLMPVPLGQLQFDVNCTYPAAPH